MVEKTEAAQNTDNPLSMPAQQGPAGGVESTTRPRRFIGILESAELIGGFAWTEQALFEVIGGWSVDETDPVTAIVFADHARRHSWHSELLLERLPELANVDVEALVRPPSGHHHQIMDVLRHSGGTLDRLVGGYRVMCARLLTDYDTLVADLDLVSAPSVHRWLGFIRADLVEQWRWGEGRIREMIRTVANLDSALAGQLELERLLL